MTMVKTFHHLQNQDQEPKQAVKTFHAKAAAKSSKVISAEPKTFHHLPPQAPALPLTKPQPLYAHLAITSDSVDAAWQLQAQAALSQADCADFSLDDRNAQRIRVLYGELKFEDVQYQSHYAAEVTESLRLLQDQLSSMVGGDAKTRLHDLAKQLLKTLAELDVGTLDPNSISAKLADWLRGRTARRQGLAQDFERTSQTVDDLLAQSKPLLAHLRQQLGQFGPLFERVESLFEQLTVFIVAAQIKLTEVLQHTLPEREATLQQANNQDPFAWQTVHGLKDACEHWAGKLHNLKLIRHTVLMTLPQLRLSQRNLLAMLNRFEDLSSLVIPSWKQQFLTALSLQDGNDESLYQALLSLQDNLRTQLERLPS